MKPLPPIQTLLNPTLEVKERFPKLSSEFRELLSNLEGSRNVVRYALHLIFTEKLEQIKLEGWEAIGNLSDLDTEYQKLISSPHLVTFAQVIMLLTYLIIALEPTEDGEASVDQPHHP